MATRGRKPKPTVLKLLESNPGKRPLNKNEPKPEKKAPKCPLWLEPEAKKEWRTMSKKLEELGVLTEVDSAAFAGYCQAYARWKEAEEFLSKHGTIFKTPSGYIQQVPQVSIAQTYNMWKLYVTIRKRIDGLPVLCTGPCCAWSRKTLKRLPRLGRKLPA